MDNFGKCELCGTYSQLYVYIDQFEIKYRLCHTCYLKQIGGKDESSK